MKRTIVRIRVGSMQDPVERCVSLLVDFTALSFPGIPFRSVAQFGSGEILCIRADAMFNVISLKAKRLAVLGDSSEGHMDVWVLGIAMHCSDPFEARPDVNFHLPDKSAGKFLEVQAVAELRRNDQFKQAGVAGPLPLRQPGI